MKQFLFCYFALFSLANAKSTPPPPGGDGDDNDDDASGDDADDDHAQVPRWKLATSAPESRGGCSTIKSSTRCRQ